jgi:hypothetical protein
VLRSAGTQGVAERRAIIRGQSDGHVVDQDIVAGGRTAPVVDRSYGFEPESGIEPLQVCLDRHLRAGVHRIELTDIAQERNAAAPRAGITALA